MSFKNVITKLQGIARNTIWSPFSNRTVQDITLDDMGRVVTWPYQVRDLITTAQVALANGTVTDLLAGVASTFHDLVYIRFQNNSTAATTISVLDDGTSVFGTIEIPVTPTAVEIKPPIPIPQGTVGGDWEIDMPDITGTTVTVNALFIKNK